MLLKTGGGSARQGLGQGIHWHVENPVYFYATDPATAQSIPYVVVTNADGTTTEYIDTESKFDPKSINKDQLQVMDCITCHNRTAHNILSPSETMDDLMGRSVVSPTIPEIHKKGTEALAIYKTPGPGYGGDRGSGGLLSAYHADFYAKNTAVVKFALDAIKDAYTNTVFRSEDRLDGHANNIQHKDLPGCFRCHDGKHVTANGKDTVRLECNLCHSIPTVSTAFQLVSEIPVAKGFEPENHKNPNWINMHRTAFDTSCSTCHTVEDPGGVSNTSFCSNSICHGSTWKFAGFDAPKLREVLKSQQPTPAPTTQATAVPTAKPTASGQATAAPTQASWQRSRANLRSNRPNF